MGHDVYSEESESGNFPARACARRQVLPSHLSALRKGPHFGLATAVTMLVMMGAAQATEVFKWKDADGHLHFGDRRPEGAAESVTIRSGPPAAANGTGQENLRQVLDGYTKDREAREASREAAQIEADRREQRCVRAKARQHSAEHANFLYDYTPSGERRVLDGAEYNQAIEKARQAVADSCD